MTVELKNFLGRVGLPETQAFYIIQLLSYVELDMECY